MSGSFNAQGLGRPANLPAALKNFLGNSVITRIVSGESPAKVHEVRRGSDRFFLKCSGAVYASTTFSVAREARVTEWLQGRLKVPEVILQAEDEQGEYLITKAVDGVPLAERIKQGQSPVELFLEAIRQLRSVPVLGCPFDSRIRYRLSELDYLVQQQLTADDYDLSRWPEIVSPEKLVERLNRCAPEEEPLFSHGDLGDSNVLIDRWEHLHFIDLGRGGIADRWMDIAFVCRALRDDISPAAMEAFLAQLGEEDDAAKRDYFEQLDELF